MAEKQTATSGDRPEQTFTDAEAAAILSGKWDVTRVASEAYWRGRRAERREWERASK